MEGLGWSLRASLSVKGFELGSEGNGSRQSCIEGRDTSLTQGILAAVWRRAGQVA